MKYNEKKYFLKNTNLLNEIHISKLTYCCYEKEEYGNYDLICKDYNLITPNMLLEFFEKNDRDYVIIRVMTPEHVLPYCSNGKINLRELKMSPFKHILIIREDFYNVFEKLNFNTATIDNVNESIFNLKEEKKENNKKIRFYKLEKEKQVPYKDRNKIIDITVKELTENICSIVETFSFEIMKYSKEVLRSHWKGETIESGEYCVSQGKLSEGLVYMIMMLIDQYAKSGNWSGYTYIDDMKGSALVQLYDVILKFEELKSNNPFAYATTVVSNKFTAILNAEKYQRKIKSRVMQSCGYNPTFNEQTNETFQNILYGPGIEIGAEEYSDETTDDIDELNDENTDDMNDEIYDYDE